MAIWYVNKNPVLEPCVFTTGKSCVQGLDMLWPITELLAD